MTEHRWDAATSYCQKCGILKGWHAEGCLATPNVTGFMHRLAHRKWEREGKMVPPLGSPAYTGQSIYDQATPITKTGGKIIVEGFPKPPPESA